MRNQQHFRPVLSADGKTWDIDATIAAGAARPLIADSGAFICEGCGIETGAIRLIQDQYLCQQCEQENNTHAAICMCGQPAVDAGFCEDCAADLRRQHDEEQQELETGGACPDCMSIFDCRDCYRMKQRQAKA